MTFTKEQMAVLATFDGAMRPFSTALDSCYLRAMTSKDVETLVAIWKDANKLKDYRVVYDCGKCVYEFVRTIGRAYRAQVASEAMIEAQKKAEAKAAKANSRTKTKKSNGNEH